MTLRERELSIPDGVIEADGVQNTELVRIWWQEGAGSVGPRMIIRPALREPELVGPMLAELAYHFSRAYAERGGKTQTEALAEIRQAWDEAHARADAQKDA